MLRDVWIKALGVVGVVLPSAQRQSCKMVAQDIFNSVKKSEKPVTDAMARPVILSLLKDSGYDIEKDKTYAKVFGLKGGVSEFDALFPKIRTSSGVIVKHEIK